MKIRLMILMCTAASCTWGGEPADSLARVAAPDEEFVRIPAKYVFQKMEKTARRSGEPALAAFKVDCQLPGFEDLRISVNMENLNLLDAIEAVAALAGGRVEYVTGSAVFKASDGSVAPAPEPVKAEPVAAPASRSKEKEAVVSFSDVDQALVFIDTGVGRGSGFVLNIGGKAYLVSNQHNFMGAAKIRLNTMGGDLLEPVSFEFCEDRDLVRLELSSEDAARVKVLSLASGNPAINQDIVVYGNSAGGNVATELKGKVLGVGPADIEVDADIVSGNSGSPVLDSSGSVLAVATYITFELEFNDDDQRKQIYKGTRFDKARRYGVRIPDDGWKKADLRNFLNQTYRLVDAKHFLEATHILIEYWNANEDYEVQARQLLAAYSTRSNRVRRPYEFHYTETEQQLSMLVSLFKRNHEEFTAAVGDMDLSKQELAEIKRDYGKKSTSKVETLDNYIRTSMLSRMRRMQDGIADYDWMTRYMADAAEPLVEMAGELIRLLESSENPYERIKERL
ncbi:S1 family peptidase [Pontiella sulfatireligans]|uniref:Serine protease HhoB n=1 Tax=Pontiella sulfatireligans TaxID=2750658 RepID=A0A6C2UIY9_9BACT|nr:serine protease [Pontiella sulfatireligans]VGO19284.1 Putative serine protease HhoB [Pontiella sulfatireligans]